MRVGFITQWYPPEHGSAALPGTIAAALADQVHSLDVVTAYPNYPEGVLQAGWRQRLSHTEDGGRLRVHRTPVYISHDERALHRMLNYLSFAFSATLTSLRRLRSVDVVWVHATPILPALPAMVLRRLFGIPFVLHIQDLWPDTVLASGMLPKRLEPFVRAPLDWFCRRVYSSASQIGIITPGMRGELVSRGVPSDKIVDIPNWADEGIFRPLPPSPTTRDELGLPDGFLAMYAGAMGEVQALETVVHAAALLRDRTDIHFVLVGSGGAHARLTSLADALGLTNITFVPPQPLARMSEVLSAGDVQLVCLRDLPLYRITLPSKVQATLAAGRPIIISAGGDAGQVVEGAAAGISCPPGDPEALAQAIRRIADLTESDLANLSAAARAFYDDNFAEDVGVRRMVTVLETAKRTPGEKA